VTQARSSAQSVQAVPVKPWIVLLATIAVQALVAMALMALPAIAPAVAKDFGISTAYLGAYVACVYVAAMFSTVMGGMGVKRWGAIRLSQMGLFCSGAGLLLSAIPHPVTIVLGAIFIGVGYGPITPASSHLLIKSTPPHQLSLVFSIKQTGVPLGGMMAGALVPPIESVANWQVALLAVGVACVLCALLVSPLRAGLDGDRDPTARASLRTSLVNPVLMVWRHPALRTLSFVSLLFVFAQLACTAYIVTFLYEDLGWGLIAAGFALTIAQAAGVGGRILWGFIADRWLGARRMLMVIATLLALAAIGAALLTEQSSYAFLFVVLAMLGSTAIGWNGVYLAEVARRAPKGQAGMATGGTLGFTYMGVAIGPSMFGLLAEGVGSYGLAYLFLVVPSTLVVYLLWRQYRNDG
jgi:sugar phosphate permease